MSKGFETSVQSLALLLYIKPMGDLQMLTGIKSEEEVRYNQKIININTNEIISESIMPEDFSTNN